MQHITRLRLGAVSVAVLLPLTAASASALPIDLPGDGGETQQEAGTQSTQSGTALEGLFRIDEGQCGGGEGVTSGSYFRMIQSNGDHVGNGDSPCDDNTFTPLEPGSDSGLVTGTYQPHPDPAFGPTGGGLNDKITEPQSFFGTEFSTATNPTDPQTDTDVPAPQVTRDGGTLSGDVRAFAAAWNGQHFNQGSPKPSGDKPGNTAGPEGTYDEATGAYTLQWTSQIEGGPFDGFTGLWHLEGTFEGELTTASAPTGSGGTGTSAAPAGGGGSTSVAGAQTGGGSGPGEPMPRTGAATAVPLGGALLALAGTLRWLAVRAPRRS